MSQFKPRLILPIYTVFIAALLCIVQSQVSYAQRAKYQIRFASVALKGTTPINMMDSLNAEIMKRTNNQVRFRIYAGNQGDESVILSKMRDSKMIHAAGFTGRGLGEILPEIRVMEVPFLFNNYNEVDYVIEKLYDRFAREFEKSGYILLGWAEAGFVHFFSTKKITGYDDLKGVRMWTWQGDPLAEAMFKALRIVPNPLPLTDVATSLQTGLIDAVYVPPYYAIGLQWAQKAKYMNALPVTNAAGAIVIYKDKFDELPAEYQNILLSSSKKWLKRLVELTRIDNERSINSIKKIGVEIVQAPEGRDLQLFFDAGKKVREEMVGVLYSRELLEQVLQLLSEFRSNVK